MGTIILKSGDSLKWHIKYKQSDNTPVDLTSFSVNVDAYDKVTNALLFKIDSTAPTANMYITTDKFNIGEFDIIVKDTSSFNKSSYSVDIQYVDAEGLKTSSKNFVLKIVDKLF